ncbi:hypothetical protein PRZ48_006093 [Zasmidium cellare]|uniref:Aminotransferase class I/classII large domain-containing protein n=1 Tax=Zasmidium cellare TaxID=395010 RepID=A0ABR0EM53_ZASCE|nr:hypothetical protein PRZ48_006093 [Zasmidium cellare]
MSNQQKKPGIEPLDLSHHFSRSSQKRAPNVLKEYYKYLRNPDMGNLAGGLPCPSYFPFEKLEVSVLRPDSLGHPSPPPPQHIHIPRSCKNAQNPLRTIDLDTALQYGGAQGYPPLHAWLKKLTTSIYHPNIPYLGGADILINGGSADGLAKVYELLFNPWDEKLNSVEEREGLLAEEFVYAPPLAQLKPKDVNVVPVRMDGEGILPFGEGGLEDVLEHWDWKRGKRPHVLYTIPRSEIYDICSRFDVVIVEDDPYWHLYYPSANAHPNQGRQNKNLNNTSPKSTGHPFLDTLIPSFLRLDTDGRVIRLDSFSKSIAPGCRLGWTTASPQICEQLFRITDGTSQQPSGFVQAVVLKLLAEGETGWGVTGWVRWLEGLRDTYQGRMIIMAQTLGTNRFFETPDGSHLELFTFSRPKGGMFLWLQINIHLHPLAPSFEPRRLMRALWTFCTQHPYRVLTVPGSDFAASEEVAAREGYRFLRFCFGAVEEGLLVEKSLAFVRACREFWRVEDGRVVEGILADEERGLVDGPDREMIGEW